MLREIDIGLLIPHPEQCNYMDEATLKRVRRHIETTGNYEPLVVRPHPRQKDRFQVINGHNRLRVLKAMGQESANCVVWETDDEQTRVYLATLNRLSGNDVPERRAMLVETLLETQGVDQLSALLPDPKKQILELERLGRIELDYLPHLEQSAEEEIQVPVILEFMLEESEAKQVNLAMDLIINAHQGTLSRGQALLKLARFYLKECETVLEKVEARDD